MSVTRSFNLGKDHDERLVRLSKKMGRTLTETIRRALELLEKAEGGEK